MISSKMKAANYLAIDRIAKYREGDIESLVVILDQHAEEARAEQRENVAAWMIHNGYSTGHGDTIEELLDELKDQVKKSPHDEG